jgi:hypothetical protein
MTAIRVPVTGGESKEQFRRLAAIVESSDDGTIGKDALP